MAKKVQTNQKLQKARVENRKLKAENAKLKQAAQIKKNQKQKSRIRVLRSVGVIFFLSLAVALLIAGNLLFWAGNTVVKNDRYAQTVSPVIKNTEVQKAVATYTTQKIYSNFDAQQFITQVLPPRADFLAPTLAEKLQQNTDEILMKVLSNPKFQDAWNQANINAHDRFINTVSKYGGDGIIDISEAYQQLSSQLKNTKLAFLADKPLPSKVGTIKIASGTELSALHRIIHHIDLWRILALVLFLLSSLAAIFLSKRRRRTVVKLGLFMSLGMLFTLIGLRVTREIVASKVNPSYSEATRQTIQIILHPLVIQTVTILLLALLVAFVAWISGSSRKARALKSKTSDLFSGKLHEAIFDKGENKFSIWLAKNKRVVQWLILVAVALVDLLIRLTPLTLITSALIVLVLIVVVEVLATPDNEKSVRPISG